LSLNWCHKNVWITITITITITIITHALNKLINIKISSARSVCSALFKMFKTFNALFTFILLIVYLTSSFKMCKSDDIVKSINEFAMLLMFVWKDEKKNFSCNISIFFLNIIVIWSVSLHFNNENWESFLNSWLSILTYFAKHHINLNASLSSCICDLKCARFACWIILFL